MPVVTPDLVHPRANAWTRWVPTAPYVNVGMTRVFLVTGLDDGAANMSARALARSLAAFGIPQHGSTAPDPGIAQYGAIALDYDTEVIPGSDNSCYVIVGYKTPVPRANGGGPALFVVSDDTALVQETTSLHPKDKSQMTITFTDPDDKQNTPNKLATFSYMRPIRRLVVSGYVVDDDLDSIRQIVGSVNDSPWYGYDIGFWRFDEFRTTGTLLGNVWNVSAGFSTRVNEDWREWDAYYIDVLGQYVQVKQEDINKLKNTPYAYGWTSINGLTVAGLHPVADFADIFGIGGGGSSSSGPPPVTVAPNG